MKHLKALSVLLLICSSAQTLRAQAGADPWVSVRLAGDGFTIQMPKTRVNKSQKHSFEQFKLKGRVYTATEDGVDYTVWSFVDEGRVSSSPADNEAYLDACADLVWESLLKPRRDPLSESAKLQSRMSYQSEQSSPARGREYTITLGYQPGVTRFFVAGQQIYVLTVLNAYATSAATQRFINSFGLKRPTLPTGATIIKDPLLVPPATGGEIGTGSGGGIGPGTGGGVGTGRGGNVVDGNRNTGGGDAPITAAGGSIDYNKVFSGKDVTQKARILSKPEPQYTESARKYAVTGTVVLRAVFSSSGQVTQIRAVKGLPHGLTLRSMAAARNIRFTPAVKDGHNVSMWFQLEYNYNLY